MESLLLFRKKIFFYKKIFAVDGAFYYLNQSGISVDYITGDFDSLLKEDIPSGLNFLNTYDQEHTDFDKALNIIHKKGFLNINVWGGSGKEQDHFLGNLSTALKYKKNCLLYFMINIILIFFLIKRPFLSEKNKKVSLFPFPEVEGLQTHGLKYPINKGDLEIGKNIGIRNESYEEKIEINYKKENY
ncbi:thiamine diphosphokinase [Blattabacterium sp. (Blattella germanica) str. Bge]|uniref:thiamine diphosphokinase n=1 Tax=Blattabacterium sp. (Blattella germanica) TaxID=624186 RepID=UPI0001BB62A8|nr:thiamine diphosphokinase [Blattabacterium sp. (Blattella germanica)]ACY40615.1 thiamine diphosphokinase [Blattabacterium sp. (Blattella germanica) str. Bge]